MNLTSILLIQCKDQIGLVALLAQSMAAAGNNIVSMREHVDKDSGMFFCRVELEGSMLMPELLAQVKDALPPDAEVIYDPIRVKKTIIFVTKEHHCLADILIRNHFKTLPIQVEAVIGNHNVLSDICNRFDVPFIHVPHQDVSKEDFEENIIQAIAGYDPDLLILAKFMRILSPGFVEKYPRQIVNIHHSFLPAFIGANPYGQAYQRGVKLIGATAHFVTNDLDEGPIISQQIIPVTHSYNAGEMAKAGKEVEQAVLARALRLVAEDRVLVCGNKTVVFE